MTVPVRCTFYKGATVFFTNGAGALHLTCLRQKTPQLYLSKLYIAVDGPIYDRKN